MNWKFLQQSFAFLKKSLYLCTEIMKSPSLYDEAQERRMNIPTTWFFWHRASVLLRSNIPQPVHPHFGIRAAGKTLTSCPSTPYRRLRNPRYTRYLTCEEIIRQLPPVGQGVQRTSLVIKIRDLPRFSAWLKVLIRKFENSKIRDLRDSPCEETIR